MALVTITDARTAAGKVRAGAGVRPIDGHEQNVLGRKQAMVMKYYEVLAGHEDLTHKETGSGDPGMIVKEILNELKWLRSAVPPPSQCASGCW